MLDISHLFVAAAYAQDAAPTTPQGPGGAMAGLMQYLPIILIFAVFWLIVIRPQQKKLEETQKMIKALQKGDRIVTSGGMHGKIVRLEGDDFLIVEIANGVEVKIGRSHVHGLEAKPQPASPEKK